MFKYVYQLMVIMSCLYGNVSSSPHFKDFSIDRRETLDVVKIHQGETLSFAISDVNDVEIYNKPENAIFDKLYFEWTPEKYQSGLFNIGFKITNDEDENSFLYLNVVVLNTVFNIPTNEKYSYLFSATDPDNDPVKIEAFNLPYGSSFTGEEFGPKLFEWTPLEYQIGIHEFTVTATDVPQRGSPKMDIKNISINVQGLSYEDMKFDFNDDGRIDLKDYLIFSKKWLKGAEQEKELRDYLISYLKMDEGEGNLVCDSSMNFFDGIVEGGRWDENGLYFNGIDSFIEIKESSSLGIYKELTVSVWVNLSENIRNTSWQKIVMKPYEDFSSPWEIFSIDLGNRSNSPRFIVSDGDPYGKSAVVSDPNIILDNNRWYHIAGVYDGEKSRLYVDGELVSSRDISLVLGNNNLPIYIGARDPYRNFFNGYISEFKIYNYAASDNEIKQIYEYGSKKDKDEIDDEIDDIEQIVYKTNTGTRYHEEHCSFLSFSKKEITLVEALIEGLLPCSRCNPPSLDIEYQMKAKTNTDFEELMIILLEEIN